MPPRPWMEAIEMQFAALSLLEMLPRPTQPHALMNELRRADTYAWTPDPLAAITEAARSIPDTATISAVTLPSPLGFWWLGPSPGRSFSALLWSRTDAPEGPVTYVYLFRQVRPHQDRLDEAPCLIDAMYWPLEQSLADGIRLTLEAVGDRAHDPADTDATDAGTVRAALTLFLAGCVWLQQRILVTSHGPIERHRRKQLAREYHVPLPGDVNIIELRRRESTPHDSTGIITDWSCQWIVGGHWTHQPYGPGHSERRLQYVLPYVKGPADKPLKVPKQTVYVVDR